MSLRRRHSAQVRWGHLYELDRRVRVGSPKYKLMPLRLRHLLSWRADHAVVGGDHLPIQMSGTSRGVRPSSNLQLRYKEAFVNKRT